MATRSSRREAEPVRITTAPASRHEEMAHRRRRYAVAMSIRTACFLAAIVVPITWLRVVCVAAALILPYVAVVMANVASPRIPGTDLVESPGGYRELDGPTR